MRRIADAHECGYGIGVGQASVNEISVAAPVIDHNGNGIAAVQIPVYKPQWTMEDAVSKLAPLAMETARSISGSLYRNS